MVAAPFLAAIEVELITIRQIAEIARNIPGCNCLKKPFQENLAINIRPMLPVAFAFALLLRNKK